MCCYELGHQMFVHVLIHSFKGGFRGGAMGAEAPPLQVYSTPVQSFARHWQSRSSLSLDNLCVMAMVKEGRMEAPVVAKMVHNASSSRLRPFLFFFALHLENWRRHEKFVK